MADSFTFEDARGPAVPVEKFTFEEANQLPTQAAPRFSPDPSIGLYDIPDPPGPHTTPAGMAGAVTRGAAPYAAGAAAGAVLGAPLAGVGAIPGAVAGAGAVGLTQLVTGLYEPLAEKFGWPKAATPQEMTDKILDLAGTKRPSTGIERTTEAVAGGAAGALTGAGAAKQIADTAVGPTTKAVAEKLAAAPARQVVSGATGGAAAQGAAEAGAGPVGQTIAGMVGSGLPFADHAVAPTKINASENAKTAINAGFVLPPAEASEGHIGEVNLTNMAAAEAGKIKLGQLAAAKNQPLVNLYAQKELGAPAGTVLTPQAFDQVRAREGKVYQEVVDAVPEVNLANDAKFKEDVAKVGARSEETEKLFPSTTEPPGVTALRAELLRNGAGSTKAVMNYIADLRYKATRNFQVPGDAMAHRMGAAQREAANALEDSMERSVQEAPEYYRQKLEQAAERRDAAADHLKFWSQERGPEYATAFRTAGGLDALKAELGVAESDVKNWTDRLAKAHTKNEDNQTLVDRFREARKTMAKSYDVESVTNVSTGDVSATGLGRLLQQGKPLTGDLKMIADSANSFRRAFQNPAAFGGVEPLSVLDLAAAGTMALHGHPVAAASILTRPFVRNRILSPGYQRGMVSGTPTPAPLSVFTQPGLFAVTPAQGATQGMPQP